MRLFQGVLLLLLAILLVAVVACQASEQALPTTKPTGGVIQVRLATQDPGPTAPLPDAYRWFAEEVTKRTDGRVKVEVIWGGALLKGTETLEGLQMGTAEAGALITQYHPGQLPLHTVNDAVPFTTADVTKALAATRQLYKEVPELAQEVERFNQIMVSLNVSPSYGLWSVKPVRSLADIKGQKVRTLGAYLPKVISAAGGEPVSMAGADIYDAMQKGTISAAVWPLEFGKIFNLQEVAKYFSKVDFGAGVGMGGIAFNKEIWQRISPQDREIILKVGIDSGDRLAQEMNKFTQELEVSLKKDGVEIVEFPAEERQKWANLPAVQSLREQWVQEMERKGLPGKKLMDLYLKAAAAD